MLLSHFVALAALFDTALPFSLFPNPDATSKLPWKPKLSHAVREVAYPQDSIEDAFPKLQWKRQISNSTETPTDPTDPTTEDPTTEDPTTEDPTTEDPTTEDPEVEDPEVEDPEEDDVEDPEEEDPTGADPGEGDTEENEDEDGTPVLIGDLKDRIDTPVGGDIASILLRGGVDPETTELSTRPVSEVASCDPSDTCCPWYFISEELTVAFEESDGTCNDMARAAVRLGFHDAGTWSQSLAAAGQDFGGADGSLALFNEDTRPENGGLTPITNIARDLYAKYHVGMGDLIQYMAIHATVTCPLGPRLRAYVGRIDATQPAPDNLLPNVHAPADDLIALFEDKTIPAHDLTALMGAHSTSKQFGVDASKSGAPQDSTPGVWDVEYYNQTLDHYESDCVFKFPSDVKLAVHPKMSNEWMRFIDDQSHWNEDYARAYTRLSLLGVNNINDLKECSMTLPARKNRIPVGANVDTCTTSSSSSSLVSSTSTLFYNSSTSVVATPTSSIDLNATSTLFYNSSTTIDVTPTSTMDFNTTTSVLYTANVSTPYSTETPSYPTSTFSVNATSSAYSDMLTTTPTANSSTTVTYDSSSVYSNVSTPTVSSAGYSPTTLLYNISTSAYSNISTPASTPVESSTMVYNSSSSVFSNSSTPVSSSYMYPTTAPSLNSSASASSMLIYPTTTPSLNNSSSIYSNNFISTSTTSEYPTITLTYNASSTYTGVYDSAYSSTYESSVVQTLTYSNVSSTVLSTSSYASTSLVYNVSMTYSSLSSSETDLSYQSSITDLSTTSYSTETGTSDIITSTGLNYDTSSSYQDTSTIVASITTSGTETTTNEMSTVSLTTANTAENHQSTLSTTQLSSSYETSSVPTSSNYSTSYLDLSSSLPTTSTVVSMSSYPPATTTSDHSSSYESSSSVTTANDYGSTPSVETSNSVGSTYPESAVSSTWLSSYDASGSPSTISDSSSHSTSVVSSSLSQATDISYDTTSPSRASGSAIQSMSYSFSESGSSNSYGSISVSDYNTASTVDSYSETSTIPAGSANYPEPSITASSEPLHSSSEPHSPSSTSVSVVIISTTTASIPWPDYPVSSGYLSSSPAIHDDTTTHVYDSPTTVVPPSYTSPEIYNSMPSGHYETPSGPSSPENASIKSSSVVYVPSLSTSSAMSSSTIAESYPTVITTSYVDICPTGLTTVPYTYTTTFLPSLPTSEVPIPDGWTTVVTLCTNCYPAPTTITLTKPANADFHPTPTYLPYESPNSFSLEDEGEVQHTKYEHGEKQYETHGPHVPALASVTATPYPSAEAEQHQESHPSGPASALAPAVSAQPPSYPNPSDTDHAPTTTKVSASIEEISPSNTNYPAPNSPIPPNNNVEESPVPTVTGPEQFTGAASHRLEISWSMFAAMIIGIPMML